MKWHSQASREWVRGSDATRQSRKKVIICINRSSFPARLTQEDFEIQQSKVPRRARFIYMLGDSADAEIMFAWLDAAADRIAKSAVAAGDGSSGA